MEKRKPGRPAGAKNKAPLKQREVSLQPNSYEVRAMQTSTTGLGGFLQLEAILIEKVNEYWTDARVLEFFATDDDATAMEDKCHFYSSSKGRVVVDDGSLSNCGLFPGIDMSSAFLSQYLHNYTDVSNYVICFLFKQKQNKFFVFDKEGKEKKEQKKREPKEKKSGLKKNPMSLRWSDVGRIFFYALGGAAVSGALGLATVVTEKKIGRQLLIPTQTLHKHEVLRCWMTELENLVLPQYQVLYLKLLGSMDQITSAWTHLKSNPKEIDKMLSAQIVATYSSLADESCARLLFQFEHKNTDLAKCADVRTLLANIKKKMYECVLSILLMCNKYAQVDFKCPIATEESQNTTTEEQKK